MAERSWRGDPGGRVPEVESWGKNPGGEPGGRSPEAEPWGILKKEFWRRTSAQGILKEECIEKILERSPAEPWREILEEESWETNPGGGILEQEPWR